MRPYPHDLKTWPRRNNGEPIFTCSEDATYFAHLVFDKIEYFDQLTRLRKKAYFDIAALWKKTDPDYQRMMDLAVRAQFYRECLEEIRRLNERKFELEGGK